MVLGKLPSLGRAVREIRESNDIAAGPGPGELLFGGRERVLWDAANDRVLKRYALPFEAFQVGATADGSYLYAADGTRSRVVVIERASGRMSEIPLRAGSAAPTSPSESSLGSSRKDGSSPGVQDRLGTRPLRQRVP